MYTSSGWSANSRPPSAGPPITESWNATDRCANALTRISCGTSDGTIARPAGAPSADATPVPNASAKNGDVSSAPAPVTASRPTATAASTAIATARIVRRG